MLDGLTVEAYGQAMPLNQVANVVAAEAQMLTITPFDPSTLQSVVAAIRADQSPGLTQATMVVLCAFQSLHSLKNDANKL